MIKPGRILEACIYCGWPVLALLTATQIIPPFISLVVFLILLGGTFVTVRYL